MTLGVVVVGGKCLASPFEGEEQVPLRGSREREERSGGTKVLFRHPSNTQWHPVFRPSITCSHPVAISTNECPSKPTWCKLEFTQADFAHSSQSVNHHVWVSWVGSRHSQWVTLLLLNFESSGTLCQLCLFTH